MVSHVRDCAWVIMDGLGLIRFASPPSLLAPKIQRRGDVKHWYRENLKRFAATRREQDLSGRSGQCSSHMAHWIEQGQVLRQKFDVQLTQPDLFE